MLPLSVNMDIIKGETVYKAFIRFWVEREFLSFHASTLYFFYYSTFPGFLPEFFFLFFPSLCGLLTNLTIKPVHLVPFRLLTETRGFAETLVFLPLPLELDTGCGKSFLISSCIITDQLPLGFPDRALNGALPLVGGVMVVFFAFVGKGRRVNVGQFFVRPGTFGIAGPEIVIVMPAIPAFQAWACSIASYLRKVGILFSLTFPGIDLSLPAGVVRRTAAGVSGPGVGRDLNEIAGHFLAQGVSQFSGHLVSAGESCPPYSHVQMVTPAAGIIDCSKPAVGHAFHALPYSAVVIQDPTLNLHLYKVHFLLEILGQFSKDNLAVDLLRKAQSAGQVGQLAFCLVDGGIDDLTEFRVGFQCYGINPRLAGNAVFYPYGFKSPFLKQVVDFFV